MRRVGGSARSTFGVARPVWARRSGPRAGPTVSTTADPTVANGTDTQGEIRGADRSHVVTTVRAGRHRGLVRGLGGEGQAEKVPPGSVGLGWSMAFRASPSSRSAALIISTAPAKAMPASCGRKEQRTRARATSHEDEQRL